MFGMALPLTTVVPARLSSFCRISSDTSLSELIRGTTSSCKATRLNSIFDCCPTFVPVTVLFALTSEDSVLTASKRRNTGEVCRCGDLFVGAHKIIDPKFFVVAQRQLADDSAKRDLRRFHVHLV